LICSVYNFYLSHQKCLMQELIDKFTKIKAFLFDVDGVLSEDTSPLDETGEPVRTGNVKDGLAIRSALNSGYTIGIITGANQSRVRLRCKHLGIRHYYENSSDKKSCLEKFMSETGISAQQILYMGDDIPDYPVMKVVEIAACPADAVPEIKSVSHFISQKEGGKGCVREVIEKVMRSQDKWYDVNGLNIH
jgi:3-deoxy-D-manno-octulosonate 8-phosphate phosphatase (KDO 8-P phosphatase)